MSGPDIVERLYAEWSRRRSKILREAAQEIDRLRIACNGALVAAGRIADSNLELRAELDKARAALKNSAANPSEAIAEIDDSRA